MKRKTDKRKTAETPGKRAVKAAGKTPEKTENLRQDLPESIVLTRYESGTTYEAHEIEDIKTEQDLLGGGGYPSSMSEVTTLPNEEDEFHLIDYLMGHSREDQQP